MQPCVLVFAIGPLVHHPADAYGFWLFKKEYLITYKNKFVFISTK